MPPKATVRELRNRFPEVRKLVEREGEVLVTERGEPKYRLSLYSPARARKAAASKDYVARMRRYQPRPLGISAAKDLDDENRGAR